ncbi:hypothetical protein EDB81DRAFT_667541 [Dactylonectria macrodidyma]|uniref:Uncharacterized protein n=1 Tax=Dactylonectria macrodidyma TaxID=307937 RepID=A0A9P9DHE9_9HYPO|nr:hypothetical protein EDB81DRAFT_667541 [Dactylonectria macrodidyma]
MKAGPKRAQINKHVLEILLSRNKTSLRREAQRGADNISLPRSGAPQKLTEDQRDQTYDTVTTNPHVAMRDLLDFVDNVIQLHPLRCLLREMNKKKWRG